MNCFHQSFHAAYMNEVVFLDCYRWYKFIDGTMRKQAVTLDDRVKQVSGTLIIKEARVEDSGKYLCVVNNSVGGESVETVLTVTGMQHMTLKFIPEFLNPFMSSVRCCLSDVQEIWNGG
jgi:hypothetical protein